MSCASVKRKGSLDQCTSKAMTGHSLCRRHARMRRPILWGVVNVDKSVAAIKIQRLVRGFLLRAFLRRNGPGVLSRSNLANDEELTSCEDKHKQDPFTYFAFEEGGKIWWFDFDTLWRWCSRSYMPTNPYTKVAIAPEVRKRLFRVWSWLVAHNMETPQEPAVYEERVMGRWNMLSQLFSSYGFGDINPSQFRRFGKVHYHTIFRFVDDDLSLIFREGDPNRERVHQICIRAQYAVHSSDTPMYVLQSTYALLYMCSVPKDPYPLIFTLLSALYRV